MFVYLIFLFLINKIYSISGGVEEIYPIPTKQTDQNDKINLDDFCPCDKNRDICEFKCCCDPDCFSYMLDENYYEQFLECDPLSYVSKRVYSKLDYCEGYQKSVEDLYNPLVLAFKILKKGFCLVKKNPKNEQNNNNNYNDLKNKYTNEDNKKETDNMFEDVIPDFDKEMNFRQQDLGNFNRSLLKAPISLPNGLCLFNSYPIKKLMDYEVECSYYSDYNQSIVDSYISNNHMQNYYIYDSTYSKTCTNYVNLYVKKIEITYYLNFENNMEYIIEFYYENGERNGFKDLTFIVKYLNDKNDYIRSGNPGYIKGKPLLISLKFNNTMFEKYKNDAVFPIDIPNPINISNDFYFDNYFDNKITFEDLIIYGYNRNNDNNINVISQLFNRETILYGVFGNANFSHLQDWDEIKDSTQNRKNIYLLMGLYKDEGAVNNTQYKIVSFNRNDVDDDKYPLIGNRYYYFITKFLKKKTPKNWWYAPGPGFIKLPQNIMYPFRIGTTKYKK